VVTTAPLAAMVVAGDSPVGNEHGMVGSVRSVGIENNANLLQTYLPTYVYTSTSSYREETVTSSIFLFLLEPFN